MASLIKLNSIVSASLVKVNGIAMAGISKIQSQTYAGGEPELEDLTTYTEVDPNSKITVTANKVDFADFYRNQTAYVVKDFGAGYFGDFEIQFEIKIDFSNNQGNQLMCGVSNTLGSLGDMQAANDVICCWAYGSNGALRIYLEDENTDSSDYYGSGGTSSNLLYCTFTRSGVVARIYFYSDSARTIPVDNVLCTCETGTKRYFYVLSSRDVGTYPTEYMDGYGQNFKIITAS